MTRFTGWSTEYVTPAVQISANANIRLCPQTSAFVFLSLIFPQGLNYWASSTYIHQGSLCEHATLRLHYYTLRVSLPQVYTDFTLGFIHIQWTSQSNTFDDVKSKDCFPTVLQSHFIPNYHGYSPAPSGVYACLTLYERLNFGHFELGTFRLSS